MLIFIKPSAILITNSASKTKYNNPIIKYCISKVFLLPNGSKPHSYCELFSKSEF
jgi:hypothetical protein